MGSGTYLDVVFLIYCVAVCCTVLHCVAACCSILQGVAVCCSVLQSVAAYNRVLQCAASCLIAYSWMRQSFYSYLFFELISIWITHSWMRCFSF